MEVIPPGAAIQLHPSDHDQPTKFLTDPLEMIRALLLTASFLIVLVGCGESAEVTDEGSGAPPVPTAQVARPELRLDGECAAVVDPVTGNVTGESCLEAGANPTVLWSGMVGETSYALVRVQSDKQFEAVFPASRYAEFDESRLVAVIELGGDPVTTVTVQQFSGTSECRVFSAGTDCVLIEEG